MDFGAVHADGIVSSDIVGYQQTNITDGNLNMTGVAFENVNGTDLNLNDLTGEGLKIGDSDEDADVVMVWRPEDSGYDIFAYCDNYDGTASWYDMYGSAEPIIPAGKGFWFSAYNTGKSNRTLCAAGAVISEDDTTINLVGGNLNMVVNPYPTTVDLNDATQVVLQNLTVGDSDEDADVVMVWRAEDSGYDIFAYCDNYDGTASWYDMYGSAEPVIQSGKGFWFSAKAGNGKALKFIRPY